MAALTLTSPLKSWVLIWFDVAILVIFVGLVG